MNSIKTLLIVFGLIVIFSACAGSSSSQGTAANLVIPKLEVKVHGTEGNNPEVFLPLLIWPSFKYQEIPMFRGGKATFCVINETDGIPIKIETQIEFIEDATCFRTYFTSTDQMPHKYEVGLVKIRILDTQEEYWTWSKSVKIVK